jgi:hypothetical protein
VYVVTSSGHSTYRWEFDYIRIRKNLHDFLWYHRHADEGHEQYIWIDQISIHQTDLAERSSQVNLMASVYQQAERFIAWLGCEPTAMAAAALLASRGVRKRDEEERDKAHVVLLNNKFFTRLWVIQEILLAKEVHLFTPGVVAPLSVLDRAYEISVHSAVPNCGPYLVWDHNREAVFGRRKLVECIERYSGNKCENPRDRLYGLLGIVQHSGGVKVDYTKKCSDVYRDALKLLGNEVVAEVAQGRNEDTQSKRYLLAALTLAVHMGITSRERNELEMLEATADRLSRIEALIGTW